MDLSYHHQMLESWSFIFQAFENQEVGFSLLGNFDINLTIWLAGFNNLLKCGIHFFISWKFHNLS